MSAKKSAVEIVAALTIDQLLSPSDVAEFNRIRAKIHQTLVDDLKGEHRVVSKGKGRGPIIVLTTKPIDEESEPYELLQTLVDGLKGKHCVGNQGTGPIFVLTTNPINDEAEAYELPQALKDRFAVNLFGDRR